jgi:hypothetical protein
LGKKWRSRASERGIVQRRGETSTPCFAFRVSVKISDGTSSPLHTVAIRYGMPAPSTPVNLTAVENGFMEPNSTKPAANPLAFLSW